MKTIDAFLNKTTMYRVVLYELIGLLVVAGIFGFFGWLPYSPINLFFSTIFIFAICWVVNRLFAWAYSAPSNPESAYITALILTLIITPALSLNDPNFLIIAFWASALAMASKYILAIGKKHIFNPAAIGVVITAFALNQSASWWIGTGIMLPFVIFGGFLVTRKIQRFDLVFSAICANVVLIIGLSLVHGNTLFSGLLLGWNILLSTPLVFFSTVMLTEPLTSPPTAWGRSVYGVITGIVLAPIVHFGSIFSTPELSLVIANIFSYAISPKKKLLLSLKEKKEIGTDTYDFTFIPDQPMAYRAGQYMEWTLANPWPDNRGIRRYFTLASSPTESELRLGVKFYSKSSSFKRKLLDMEVGDTIVANGLAGDFVLPKDKKKKLVFIAGGIGVTPFRSMTQYLIDRKDPRVITLLYSNKDAHDVVYKEVFDMAEQKFGMKTVYVLTNPAADMSAFTPTDHTARTIDAHMITHQIPDFKERIFYLSGPHAMVTSFETILLSIGIKSSDIYIDFFPGFA